MSAILNVAIAVLYIASLWVIFTKAGKPGWACLIPFYNIIVLLEIVGKPWWWLFLVIILPFIFGIWMLNLLSIRFGKGVGFTLGLIFLGFIFFPILAFSDAKYTAPVAQ
jgi:hypothetical protein